MRVSKPCPDPASGGVSGHGALTPWHTDEALRDVRTRTREPWAIDLLLRLAEGAAVSSIEARRYLLRRGDCEDPDQRERGARRRARDEALSMAARELAGTASTWGAARKLSEGMARFRVSKWQQIQSGFPCLLSPAEAAMQRACLIGESIPETPNGLYEILKRNTGF